MRANSARSTTPLAIHRNWRRRLSAYLRGVIVLSTISLGGALGPSTNAGPDGSLKVEVAPGRSLQAVCAGAGDRTVIFDAGGSDWSSIWAPIMPSVAKYARACAYDRAGLGASDPAPGPRSPIAVVEDLHSLIQTISPRKPVVLVGHSLGGFNMKLYAALYPKDVAGLVLLDPSEERAWDRTRIALVGKYGSALAARAELVDHRFLEQLIDKFRNCVAEAGVKGLEEGSAIYKRCTDPPRPQIGIALAKERGRVMAGAGYQAAQASELAGSVYGSTADDAGYARLFRPGLLGRRPMVVLTHVEPPSDDPIDRLWADQGRALARETARLSRAGEHHLVDRSGHYLQLDRPDAVIDAIERVVRLSFKAEEGPAR